MAHLVGDTITDYIDLFDASGTAITGATFTTTTQDPDGDSFTLTVTEQTGGRYRVRFTADAAGQWYWRAVYAGPPVQVFHETVDVDATATVAGSIAATSGQTRKDLRRMVGRGLGDCVVCVA